MPITSYASHFKDLPGRVASTFVKPEENTLVEVIDLALPKLNFLEDYANGVISGRLGCDHDDPEGGYIASGKALLEVLATIVLEKPATFPVESLMAHEPFKDIMGQEEYEYLMAQLSKHTESDPTGFLSLWLSNELVRHDHYFGSEGTENHVKLEQDVRLLWFALAHFEGVVKALVSRPLSCEHETLYASGVVSEGNRIFTAPRLIEQLDVVGEAIEGSMK